MLYFIVFAIGIILSAINDKKRLSFYAFVLILLLMAFFRYGVGADYFSYNYLYSRLNTSAIAELTSGLDEQEVGFRFIGALLKSIGSSYQVSLAFYAAVNLFFISKICLKHAKNPTLAMLIYFCFYYLVWTFSGIREGLSIAIGMYYLLKYINTNKHIRFLLIVAVLIFIHTSAIILIPLYIAGHIKFTKKSLLILLACSIAFAFIPLQNLLKNFEDIPLAFKAIKFMDTGSTFTNVLDFKSVGRLLFVAIMFFYYDTYAKQDEFSRKILNIYIVTICLYFILQFSELTAARLSIYGKLLDIVILTNTYYLYKNRIDKILYAILLFLMLFFYLNKELGAQREQTGVISDDKLMPYTNVFNMDKYEFDNRYYERMYKDNN